MKTPPNHKIAKPERRFHLPLVRVMFTGIAISGCFAQATATGVDSELVLLVDVSQSGLSNPEFGQVMDGYASAFTSTQILNSIQSGAYGRIAVSMMFFGNSAIHEVGIPWMMIGNASQAQQFANLVRNVNRPFSSANPDVGAALTAATLTFGTETGGVSNGFESAAQIIQVAAGKAPQNGTAGAAAASSATALASGVDLINSLGVGNHASAVDSFYASNVIGSTIAGVPASSSASVINAALAATMSGALVATVQTGATMSTTAVPEASTFVGLIPATFLLLRRRRR